MNFDWQKMTKQQKQTVMLIGLVGLAILFVIYQFVLTPFVDKGRQAAAELESLQIQLDDATRALIDCLPHLPGKIILVSNEVGCGIVPMHAVSRLFADEQGRLNQRVAAVCERVTLVAAGLPLALKREA